MISKLFSRRAAAAAPAPAARLPDGQRLYAVGDIHGRLDLLDALLQQIEADDSHREGSGDVIFLGDLVDRGPDSAAVIDRLIAFRDEYPRTRFLLGNHEEVFLSVLDGGTDAMRFFHRIGGMATILSYGISQGAYDRADFAELSAMIRAAVPDAHRAFLASFESLIVEGDYVFVHAGIRPGVALDAQKPRDLRWIRDEFLSAPGGFDKVVVHGHTIFEDVVDLPHRIGIDTGAYRTGRLTALALEGDRRWFLEASERRIEAAA